MITEKFYGTLIYDLDAIGHTKEAIIEKYNESVPYQENVSFQNGLIRIRTVDTGEHFEISKRCGERKWFYTLLHDGLKFKTVEDFADLILNYSEEKVEAEYEKDNNQVIKHLIDSLSEEEKDKLLFAMMTMKSEGDE